MARRRKTCLTVAVLVAACLVFLALASGAQPVSVPGLAEAATVSAERDGSFRLTLSFRVVNGGSSEIGNLVVEDDLSSAFSGASYHVLSLESKTAAVRSDYDGRQVVALLAGSDRLSSGQELEITLVLRVALQGGRGTFTNNAIVRGTDPAGTLVSDRSQDGREPDPDLDGDPTHDNAPTVVEMVAVPRVGAAMASRVSLRRRTGSTPWSIRSALRTSASSSCPP